LSPRHELLAAACCLRSSLPITSYSHFLPPDEPTTTCLSLTSPLCSPVPGASAPRRLATLPFFGWLAQAAVVAPLLPLLPQPAPPRHLPIAVGSCPRAPQQPSRLGLFRQPGDVRMAGIGMLRGLWRAPWGWYCCLSRHSRGSSHGPTERHRGRASTACITAGLFFRSPRYVHEPRDSSL
jgi:hypothetical protein